MSNNDNNLINSLNSFGFTNTESEIYLILLRQPDLTGYRIAKLMNKQASNIYKALESLKIKGAIIYDESENNQKYSAIPVKEFLSVEEDKFRKRKKETEKLFSNIQKKKNRFKRSSSCF